MTVTPTYDSTLSRVRVAATGLGSAVNALFERSTDQITWSTVRGGTAVVVSGGTASLDDYEFAPNVVNYYRVTTPKDITFVAAGTAAHANNASVTPGLPAGAAAGDLLIGFAASRDFAATPATPAGYTALLTLANVKFIGKIHSGSESAPTITFSGGAAGQETSAQLAAFRNVQLLLSTFQQQFNSTAQNVAYPATTISIFRSLLIYFGWRQDDWTSVATLAGDGGAAAEIGEPTTATGGNGQGLVWDYVVQTSKANVAAGSFVVTGGTAANSRGGVLCFPAIPLVQTASITPNLTQTWLKSVSRPFLNSPIVPLRPVTINSGARNGVFEVVGRSLPVALTDVRAHRAFTLRMYTDTRADRDRLQLVLDSGDPVFLHTPPGSPVDSMYGVLGDEELDDTTGVFAVAFRRVAAPGPDVVGSTSTWQTVVNTYATWADVIAANATWADLLNLVGSPSEVIVP